MIKNKVNGLLEVDLITNEINILKKKTNKKIVIIIGQGTKPAKEVPIMWFSGSTVFGFLFLIFKKTYNQK